MLFSDWEIWSLKRSTYIHVIRTCVLKLYVIVAKVFDEFHPRPCKNVLKPVPGTVGQRSMKEFLSLTSCCPHFIWLRCISLYINLRSARGYELFDCKTRECPQEGFVKEKKRTSSRSRVLREFVLPTVLHKSRLPKSTSTDLAYLVLRNAQRMYLKPRAYVSALECGV